MKRDLAETIGAAIDYRIATLRVAMPGSVQAYDATKQTADVKPLVSSAIALEDGTLVEELPVLYGVPVEFPRGKGFVIHFPLDAGDTGMLEFTDFSIDDWRASGQPGAPTDLRTHALGNAVFRPGLSPATHPVASPPAGPMVGFESGVRLLFDPAAGTISAGPDGGTVDFVALAAKVNTELTRIQTYMNLIDAVLRGVVGVCVSGSPDPLWTALKAAILATPYPAPASTAGTVLKGAQ